MASPSTSWRSRRSSGSSTSSIASTGAPIWPIEERPVPKSDVPGEETWPTQPFPTNPPPFARQTFTADDINPHLDEAERERLKVLLQNARNEGLFTPQTADARPDLDPR